MLRCFWDIKSPFGPAESVGDAGAPARLARREHPAVAVGTSDGQKCANLTFSCSLKCILLCVQMYRAGTMPRSSSATSSTWHAPLHKCVSPDTTASVPSAAAPTQIQGGDI